MACSRRALALDAGLFDAWYGLGCAELARGATGSAVAALREAVRRCPDRADACFNLGKGLFDLGEADAALEQLKLAATAEDSTVRSAAIATIAGLIPGASQADNADVFRARRAWAAAEESKIAAAR